MIWIDRTGTLAGEIRIIPIQVYLEPHFFFALAAFTL